MKALTLQMRIIVLLTLFMILTIATFVVVQLWHELRAVNQNKRTKALIVSLAIENIWEKVSNLKVPQDMKTIFLQKKLNSLEESQSIARAYIMDTYGRVVSFTKKANVGLKGDSNDFSILNKFQRESSIKTETIIDEGGQTFSLYLPLREEEELQFIVRMFFSLGDLTAALKSVYGPAATIGIGIIIVNVILGISLSRIVVGPIKVFNEAAGKIASGRLDLKVEVHTADELEELAEAFNSMTAELLNMKERAENANPLTKLPGNIAIMEIVENKIREGKKFIVIYCDLDNFKAFNDKYGIHKGDEAIKLAGGVFKEAVRLKGGVDDFIGHEGGDDFILLTSPERAQKIADYIISEFDKRIRFLYDQRDLERGYITAEARDGSVKQFPIMTISLAGVSNEDREIRSYGEVTNIAAEIKKSAKSKEKSCFVADRRRD